MVAKLSSCLECMREIACIGRLLPKNRDLKYQSSIVVNKLNEADFILAEFIRRDAFARVRQLIRSGLNVKPTSSTIRLSPYVDDRGIMRVGGRLGNCDLPVSSYTRFIRLPKKAFGYASRTIPFAFVMLRLLGHRVILSRNTGSCTPVWQSIQY
jgi:hypothetical protein